MNETNPTTAHLGLSADEVLTTTRAVRKRLDFDRSVPREVIGECVRIAQQAPSGRNRGHWDFVFVEDAELREQVADIWRRGMAAPWPPAGSGIAPASFNRVGFESQEWSRMMSSLDHLTENLHRAPVLLIPCMRLESRDELHTVRGQAGGWGSSVPAFWSFMLAARERGIGTAWTTAHLEFEREMADLLGIPFDTVVQVALTPVAYTIGTDFKEGPRSEEDDMSHWDRW